MKEVSSSILRAGLSGNWYLELQPKFYTAAMLYQNFLYRLLYVFLTRHNYFAVINLKILTGMRVFYFYFHFYPTQLTHRYLKMRIREQRHVNNDYLRLQARYRFCRHAFNYKQFINKNYLQNSFKLIFKNKKLKDILKKGHWLNNLISGYNNNLQIQKRVNLQKNLNNAIKNKIVSKPLTIQKLMFNRFLFLIEKTFSIYLKKTCKFGCQHVVYLLTSPESQVTELTFSIYTKLSYLHKSYLFLDCLNIVLITLRFKLPDILILFLAREFETGKLHSRLLHIIRQVALEVYSTFQNLHSFRLLITGPINKHSRTKQYKLQCGSLATHTISHSIVFFRFFANSRFGSLGLRLWIH